MNGLPLIIDSVIGDYLHIKRTICHPVRIVNAKTKRCRNAYNLSVILINFHFFDKHTN